MFCPLSCCDSILRGLFYWLFVVYVLHLQVELGETCILYSLFMPDGINRIHVGGFTCRYVAEYYADGNTYAE